MVRPVLLASLALVLAACSAPNAPDKEQPPEPQASTVSPHRDLVVAVNGPLDRARDAQGSVDASATARREALETAEAGAPAAKPAAP